MTTTQALYQQMKLTILLTAQDGVESSPFPPAYLLAWDDGIYPILHDGADWHKPHADGFRVDKERAEALFKRLCDAWDGKEELTFYDLESELGIHGSAHTTGEWERYELVSLCRYLCLHGTFDKDFWTTLTRNGDCPSEAHCINDSSESLHIYFC